jgi:hypothetical protein
MTDTPSGPTREQAHKDVEDCGLSLANYSDVHCIVDDLFDRLEAAEQTASAACRNQLGADDRIAALERENADWQRRHRQRTEDAEKLLKERDDAKEAVQALLYQFAYDCPGPVLTTDGLSALEYGFDIVGWSDPHPIPGNRCDEPGCIERTTCAWPSEKGYRRTCSKHMMAKP